MSESPLFKRAFVRGLNTELIRSGVAQYPSKEAADLSADYVADNIGMPDPHVQPGQLTTKVAAAICNELIKVANHFCEQEGGYLPEVTKTAQAASPEDSAVAAAWEVMEKAAADTGSLIEGGEVPNDMPAGAGENAESALENKRRPENYANLGEDGVGGYERKGQGSVGTEENHPKSPGASDAGSNSPIENSSKHGSLSDVVARIAKLAGDTGSLIEGGEAKTVNDQPAAAAENAEAALEAKRRPENIYNKGEKGVGRSDMVPGPAQQVGTEQPHPESPKATDSGKQNAPLEHIQAKSAAFNSLFEETAKEVVPYMPSKLEDDVKVAHVRALMGLEAEKRASYLKELFVSAGGSADNGERVKTHYLSKVASATQTKEASELPPALNTPEPAPESDRSLSSLRNAIQNLSA
jgi:hypothetical protein